MEDEIANQEDPSLTDEDFCASDVRFHRALVDSTGNGPLKLMMYTVIEAFIPITNMIVFRVRERRQVVNLHREIVEGLRSADAARAVKALNALLDYVTNPTRPPLPRAKAARALPNRRRDPIHFLPSKECQEHIAVMSETFNAMVIDAVDGKPKADFGRFGVADLPDLDVLVEIHFSTLNYKDGLAVSGKGRIARRTPLVAGIDLAGVVVESRSPDWKPAIASSSTVSAFPKPNGAVTAATSA